MFMDEPTHEPVAGDEKAVAGAKDDIHEFEIRGKGRIVHRESAWMCYVFPEGRQRFLERPWHETDLDRSLANKQSCPGGGGLPETPFTCPATDFRTVPGCPEGIRLEQRIEGSLCPNIEAGRLPQ